MVQSLWQCPRKRPLALGAGFHNNVGVNRRTLCAMGLVLCLCGTTRAQSANPAAGKMESLAHLGSVEKVYVSLPVVPPVGGLVLVHDWWGLTEALAKTADALAAEGYIVVAVDFYDRKVPKTTTEAQVSMSEINRPGALRIIHSAIRLLHEDRRFQVEKIGIIGWSMGAGLALESAIGNPNIDACVLYYGPVVLDEDRLRQLHAPVLGIYGTRDTWITPEITGSFRKALRAAGVQFEFLELDAPHMFATPASADYDAKATARARLRVSSFLKKNVFVVIAPPVRLPPGRGR